MEGIEQILQRLATLERRVNTHTHTGADLTRPIRIERFTNVRLLASGTNTSVSTTVGGDLLMPQNGYIVAASVYVDTAGTTGNTTIDINRNGSSILVNTLNIASGTKKVDTTYQSFASTGLTEGDIITVDVDAVATTPAKGLSLIIQYTT